MCLEDEKFGKAQRGESTSWLAMYVGILSIRCGHIATKETYGQSYFFLPMCVLLMSNYLTKACSECMAYATGTFTRG